MAADFGRLDRHRHSDSYVLPLAAYSLCRLLAAGSPP
jgi:hypothetical protein